MVDASKVTEDTFRPDSPPITRDYLPTVYQANWNYFAKAPPFTLLTLNNMLVDFRIRWGLWMIKGPILCKAKFFVKTDNAEVKDFLVKDVTRFWRTSVMRAMKAVEWGFSCSEALYTQRGGLIHFDSLKDLHSLDCRCLTKNGSVFASRVNKLQGGGGFDNSQQRLVLYGPRKFWHTAGREFYPYYGQSRLFGAYLPWIALWGDGGYRDAIRLFMHKYAFDGGGIYHPPGSTPLADDGTGFAQRVPWKDIARDLLEKKKNGGTLTLPGTTDQFGKRVWEVIPPTVNPIPDSLVSWGEVLKDEMWEGMGIPPEIASAQGTGAFNGRMVPLMGYYTILQELVYWLIHDADEQIFRPLVDFNFGPGIEYEIIPFSLLEELGDATDPNGTADKMGMPDPNAAVGQNGSGGGPPQYRHADRGNGASAMSLFGTKSASLWREIGRFNTRTVNEAQLVYHPSYSEELAREGWTPNRMVF